MTRINRGASITPVNIAAYLDKHGVSQEEFGRRLKNPVSQGLVWQWINGKTTITLERAREIVAASNGEITPHDLLPAHFPKGFRFPPEPEPDRKKAAA